jgi:adenine-specific DNA methylase
LVPKDREIVKNPKQGKNGSFYEDGLRRVFSECHRVLKDAGLLVFTFHHKAFEAWVNVLRAVLDAGFFITATYPVRSEMSLSVHIQNYQSISYDAILVCRKRGQPIRRSWGIVRKEIERSGTKAVAALRRSGAKLSTPDAYVAVLGKCLQCYSTHYPEVYADSEQRRRVSIEEALRGAEDIVAKLCGGPGAPRLD